MIHLLQTTAIVSAWSRRVRVVAPTAANALPDRTFQQGTGVQTVPTAGDFTNGGEALTFSLQSPPAQVTIDSATGNVFVATGALLASSIIVVRATNSVSFADSAFSVEVVAEAVAGDPVATTSLSRLDYGDGAYLDLPQTMEVAQWADGTYVVIDDGAGVSISGDFPASDLDENGHIRNGLQDRKDFVPIPYYVNTSPQGFSELMGRPAVELEKGTYRLPYEDPLNKAPSRTGTPWQLSSGAGGGLAVKAVQGPVSSRIDSNGQIKYDNDSIFEKLMMVTTAATPPNVGDIRPAILGEDRTSKLNLADADFSLFRDYATPTGLPNTIEACIAYMQNVTLNYIQEGEKRRGLCVPPSYARDIMKNFVQPAVVYMGANDVSLANRDAILAPMMAHVTDIWAIEAAGGEYVPGAGQHVIDHFLTAVVGTLVRATKPEFYELSQRLFSNLNGQSFWVKSNDIGYDTNYQSRSLGISSVHNSQPALPAHLGHTVWTSGGKIDPNAEGGGNTLPTARYHDIGTTMSFGLVPLGMIDGGWVAAMGPRSGWDETNNRFAALVHLDQERPVYKTDVYYTGTNRPDDYALALYDANRATMPHGETAEPIYQTIPVQTSIDLVASGVLTPTATGVNIDFAAMTDGGEIFTGSNLSVSYEMRRSFDGVQWTAPISVQPQGSLAFTGTQRIQERRINSVGPSPWSVNFPLFDGLNQAFRNIVAGGAIPVGAPVNVTAPKLYVYPFSETVKFPYYEEAGATMRGDKTVLVIGAGIWQNGIASAAYSLETRTNGGAWQAVSGATAKEWVRASEDLSSASTLKEFRGKVVGNDGNGNTTTVYTDAIAMPTPAAITRSYETDVSADYMASKSGTLSYAPGELRLVAAETFEGIDGPAFPVVLGAEYTIEVDVRNDQASNRIVEFVVGTENSREAYGASSNTAAGGTSVTLTKTITATKPNIYVRPRTKLFDAGGFAVLETRIIPPAPPEPVGPVLADYLAFAASGTPGTLSLSGEQFSLPGNGASFVGIAKRVPLATYPAGTTVRITVTGVDMLGLISQITFGTEATPDNLVGPQSSGNKVYSFDVTWPSTGDDRAIGLRARGVVNGTLIMSNFTHAAV